MVLSILQKRLPRTILLLLGAIVVILSFSPIHYAQVTARDRPEDESISLHPISNETLGTQKIFVVNLPSRPDKRDNIILGSSVSGFRVEWVDGVTPDEVNPKSIPHHWNPDHKPTEYAARRAHVNAMQQIVQGRLGSAIIMEDDVDWDVTLQTQLQSYALAVRALQGSDGNSTGSPYGDDWDVLWLGHCGLSCKTELPVFLSHQDSTVLPPHHFLPYWRDPPPIDRPDHTRLVCSVGDAVCSLVYAVSYFGAQKILAALSVSPGQLAEQIDIGAQFDVSLGRMCGHGYLRCFGAYPSLTGGYQPAGSFSKTSDIHDQDDSVHGAYSFGVMYSTMLNVNRLLSGERTVHATWDDVGVPLDADPRNFTVLGGSVAMLGEDGMQKIVDVSAD
ncbi:uncharacterized protein BO95DRAFT_481398 [Aspergillus brunneoviolaceus CBS 621.78]|uniref:Uncharacterized protein n=1 Tax=Aspergillus brunneoviolaceus CBS 621.78 TaxID=1450534 RepID=A0ACD1GCS0_9EURO|nr:hypothetical protein BO95DRAFT_481398 [Aspergillus brunneoviolaceus CBS 621.78]RAH46906.1 hypothetical protein BO95DRAFT_481398 [Aspergillus brunneoviolaceus CBS 621.78]